MEVLPIHLPRSLVVHRVFISSPNHLDVERKRARIEIQQWNQLNADRMGVLIQPLMWEKDVYAKAGNGVQVEINQQIFDKSDSIIVILPDQMPSGRGVSTISEIERAEQRGIQIHPLWKVDDEPVGESNNLSAQMRHMKRHLNDRGPKVIFDEIDEFVFRLRAILQGIADGQSEEIQQFRQLYKIPDNEDFEDTIARLYSRVVRMESVATLTNEIVSSSLEHTTPLNYRLINDIEVMKSKIEDTDKDLSELVKEIITSCDDRPLLVEIANLFLKQFKEEIRSLLDCSNLGYSPPNLVARNDLIKALYADSLIALRATAVQPSVSRVGVDSDVKVSYFGPTDFGALFMEMNMEALERDVKIQRVFITDSLAFCVKEPWFKEDLIRQVNTKAEIKVAEVEGDQLAGERDFGIYSHQFGKELSLYELQARTDELISQKLNPVLRSPVQDASLMSFEEKWEKGGESIRFEHHRYREMRFDAPVDGYGRLNDLFEGRVILRDMKRLDTGALIAPGFERFVRKFELDYSRAICSHLASSEVGFESIVYIGDTYRNDGGLIRNLQKLLPEKDVFGFICEPSLGFDDLWFQKMYYSSKWVDVLRFLQLVHEKVDLAKSIAIFDIDQTLWAGKGMDDSLEEVRIQAILTIIDECLSECGESYKVKVRRFSRDVYHQLDKIEFDWITADNEDFKAVLTMCIALCVYQGAHSEGTPLDADEYRELGYHHPSGDLNRAIQQILYEYQGSDSIVNFLWMAIGEADEPKCKRFAEEKGFALDVLVRYLREVCSAVRKGVAAPFKAFRAAELAQSLALASENENPNRLCINRVTWDVASAFSERGIPLLALSDRPDEATYSKDEGSSLLNTKMLLRGPTVLEEINKIL